MTIRKIHLNLKMNEKMKKKIWSSWLLNILSLLIYNARVSQILEYVSSSSLVMQISAQIYAQFMSSKFSILPPVVWMVLDNWANFLEITLTVFKIGVGRYSSRISSLFLSSLISHNDLRDFFSEEVSMSYLKVSMKYITAIFPSS